MIKTIIGVACASLALVAELDAQEKPVTEKLVSISKIIPTLEQLGDGWYSNRVCALIEPLDTPSERADPGVDPGWMGFARGAVTNGHREAYAMVRLYYRSRSCIVWVQRWETKERIGTDWGQDKDTKDSPGVLPKVGDEVRFSQRHGMHNNIDFTRGRYLISVESPSTRREDLEPLKHLAEVLDANFLKAKESLPLGLLGLPQADPTYKIKQNRQGYSHWHFDDPEIDFSIGWEKVSPEVMVEYIEELKRKPQQQTAGVGPGDVAWKIHVERGRKKDGHQYLGWLWFGADTNRHTLEQWGNPVVYDVRRLPSNSISILYGNKVLLKSDVREIDPAFGEMKLLRTTNWWRSSMPSNRITLELPPFPQGREDYVRKFSHENDPMTITVSRLEATPEQLIKVPWALTWNFHFWSTDLHKTNYIGSFMYCTTRGEPGIGAQGEPVIYDAMLAEPGTLVVVCGDKITTHCQARESRTKDSWMGSYGRTNFNWECWYNQWPRSWYPTNPIIERAFLKVESATNLTAILVSDTGVTNRAIWQPPAGWKRITPHLNCVQGKMTDDP